jgi:hypothetical protein
VKLNSLNSILESTNRPFAQVRAAPLRPARETKIILDDVARDTTTAPYDTYAYGELDPKTNLNS